MSTGIYTKEGWGSPYKWRVKGLAGKKIEKP